MKLSMVLLLLSVIFMVSVSARGRSCRQTYTCDDDEHCWNGECVAKDPYSGRRRQLNEDYYGGYRSSRSRGFNRKSSGSMGRRHSDSDGFVRHETVSKKVSGSRL